MNSFRRDQTRSMSETMALLFAARADVGDEPICQFARLAADFEKFIVEESNGPQKKPTE